MACNKRILLQSVHKRGLIFHTQVCISNVPKLALIIHKAQVIPDTVEIVLELLYANCSDDIYSNTRDLPVWCGREHKFQPRQEVLFNDNPEISCAFEPGQVKFLWIPEKISTGSGIAKGLGIKSLSSSLVKKLQTTPASSTLPLLALFSPIVRRALCCWHYRHNTSDWMRCAPEKIQSLLTTSIHERQVVVIETMTCARVHNTDIPSTHITRHNTYFDRNSTPPTLCRTILQEDPVIREFSSNLAQIMNITGERKHSFCYFIEEAVHSQKQSPSKFQLDLEQFSIPHICQTSTSTAYVKPLSEAEKLMLNSSLPNITLTSGSQAQLSLAQQSKDCKERVALVLSSLAQVDCSSNTLSLSSLRAALVQALQLTNEGLDLSVISVSDTTVSECIVVVIFLHPTH
jgi:hypothetical protein